MPEQSDLKEYGHNVYVRRIPADGPDDSPQYNVLKGRFCVKVFYSAGEADAYARRLAQQQATR
jgi:hypothetical protein